MKAADPFLTGNEQEEKRNKDEVGEFLVEGKQPTKEYGNEMSSIDDETWKPYGFAALTVGLGIAYSYLKT